MVIGLVGLVMMALPALGGRHLPPLHGHGHGAGLLGHGGPGGAAHAHATALPAHGPHQGQSFLASAAAAHSSRRFIPSLRAVFSVFALYGAIGNALVHAAKLPSSAAALVAIVPALLVEWWLIRPVWNLMFRFKADASRPL